MTKVYCDKKCWWNEYGGCQRDKLCLVDGKCVESKEKEILEE